MFKLRQACPHLIDVFLAEVSELYVTSHLLIDLELPLASKFVQIPCHGFYRFCNAGNPLVEFIDETAYLT